MPRDKDTGKTRGFGFIMYEDQRSTVLAVDNLSGGKVLDRIIRVDHVKNYKQPKVMTEEGEMVDREEQSLNAMPQLIRGPSVLLHIGSLLSLLCIRLIIPDGYVSDEGCSICPHSLRFHVFILVLS